MIIDCHRHVNNHHDEAMDDLQACVQRLLRERLFRLPVLGSLLGGTPFGRI